METTKTQNAEGFKECSFELRGATVYMRELNGAQLFELQRLNSDEERARYAVVRALRKPDGRPMFDTLDDGLEWLERSPAGVVNALSIAVGDLLEDNETGN